MSRPLAASCLAALLACTVEPAPSDSETSSTGGSTGGATDEGASSGGPGTSGPAPTTGEPGSGSGTGDPGTSTTSTSGDATTSAASTTGDGTTGDGTTGDLGPEPELPAPTKPCPEIVDGTVEFQPEGVSGPRDVRIWIDPEAAAQADGPVVFYWHGTGGQPDEALVGIGELGVQEILDAGGLVIAPTHDPMAGIFPWFLVLGEQLDDLLIADEALACAREQVGVDARRIYTLGFSAGGLHTAQMSVRRSGYLSAAVPYSGGLIFGKMPEYQDPDNKFAAMIFHGGASDVVVVGFKQAREARAAYLDASGRFSFICDHGGGHQIPDAQDSVVQFLFDHPWGTAPEPYAQALPADFPPYCALP